MLSWHHSLGNFDVTLPYHDIFVYLYLLLVGRSRDIRHWDPLNLDLVVLLKTLERILCTTREALLVLWLVDVIVTLTLLNLGV